MKKLILSAAIILGSFTAFAQEATNPLSTGANAQTGQTASATQEEYTEVKLEEVPTAITEAIKKSFPDATIDKAFINANKEYKLEVTSGGKKGNLFTDANGKLVNK
jgi:hypothetical protein